MGLIGDEMRLPMCPMNPSNLEKLKRVLTDYGII